MFTIRSLIDRLVLPVLGCALALLAVLLDLLGIGSPGFGLQQWVLFITGLGILFASLILRVRVLHLIERIFRATPMGWREVVLAMASLLLTGVLADLLLRTIMPPRYTATRYGWQMGENAVNQTTVEDSPGQFRDITLRSFQNGFKRWGDTATDKYKVFVLGDSFTHMTRVAYGEEWYAYLENHFPDIELFVYGAGGYGSLQEYMVLDDYIDTIEPDAILWQFCSNDYANNLYDLDRLGYPYNNHAVRPYLEGDKIVYRLPLPLATYRAYSFTADRLLKLYDEFMWHRTTQDLAAYTRSQAQLTEEELAKRRILEKKAWEVTLQIMKKVTARSNGRRIYLFNACSKMTEQDSRICSETGIQCLAGISEYVAEKEKEGLTVRVPNDGHWNKLGNQFAGEKIVAMLRETEFQTVTGTKMDIVSAESCRDSNVTVKQKALAQQAVCIVVRATLVKCF